MTENLTDQERGQLAHALMQVFDRWGLEPDQRMALLGLPAETKTRFLTRLRQGEPLPADEEIMLRARYLLEIEHALDTALPMNAALTEAWIVTENMLLGNRRPLDVMIEDGLEGLTRVSNSLNAGGDW